MVFAVGCASQGPAGAPVCAPVPRAPVRGEAPPHVVDDALAVAGEAVPVTGRFAGARARICAYVKTGGSRWALRGEGSSDALGWASIPVGAFSTPGDYSVRLETPEDGAGAEATIFVRARGTRLAVFDVDGTLTTSEFISAVLQGPEAEPRAFGRELAELLRDRGCFILYLTARPHEMTDATRRWREHWGFPAGVVHVSRSALGVQGRAAARFKQSYLEQARGPGEAGASRFVADFAFGNMPSDLSAYSAVYPQARIYLMDYVPPDPDAEPKQPTSYRTAQHTWESVVHELGRLPRPVQPGGCR